MKNTIGLILILSLAVFLAFAAGCTSNSPSSPHPHTPTPSVAASPIPVVEQTGAGDIATPDTLFPPTSLHTLPPTTGIEESPSHEVKPAGTDVDTLSGSPDMPAPMITEMQGYLLNPTDFPEGYALIHEGAMLPGEEECPSGGFCYLGGYSISMVTGDAQNTTLVDQMISRYTLTATRETLNDVLMDQFPEIAAGSPAELAAPALGDASVAYRFEFPSTEDPLHGFLVIFGKGNLYEIIMIIGTDADELLAFDLANKASAKLP
ncbi:MAG TPA: hypothetical protein PK069_04730 [Methanolinea sp.]|nr:hypothetical protein [Methanolinea sp.]HQK55806.1 hypothetical protein [Methanolinea sp.]